MCNQLQNLLCSRPLLDACEQHGLDFRGEFFAGRARQGSFVHISMSTRRKIFNQVEPSVLSSDWMKSDMKSARSSNKIRQITYEEACDPLTIQALSCVCVSVRVCRWDRGNDCYRIALRNRRVDALYLGSGVGGGRMECPLLYVLFTEQDDKSDDVQRIVKRAEAKIELSAAHCRERSVR